MRLAGKKAVVTGGSRGIGRAIAFALAREGADVAIADIRVGLALKTAKAIKALGRKALAVEVDVRKSEEVKKMVEGVLDEFGKIDILVNNAGVAGTTDVVTHAEYPWEIDETQWDATFDINTKGTYLCCKYVVPHMIRQRSGKIINIASVAGKVGVPYFAHYSASKAAVINYTQSLAISLGEHNINVNDICPGVVWTPMWHKTDRALAGKFPEFKGKPFKSVFNEFVDDTALRKPTRPEDIANVVVFLASKEAEDITGQSINVDSGMEYR